MSYTDSPMSDLVLIVPYDPAWPAAYETERAVILAATGHLNPEIQHIGSTAVPGMAGKPLVDVMVAVEHLGDLAEYVPVMASIGYENEPINNTGHWFFWKGEPRSHQVHIVERDSWHYWRLLLFRDYLRLHADEAPLRLIEGAVIPFSADTDADG